MTPKSLRIYEAHVGMSSEGEPNINTYDLFRSKKKSRKENGFSDECSCVRRPCSLSLSLSRSRSRSLSLARALSLSLSCRVARFSLFFSSSLVFLFPTRPPVSPSCYASLVFFLFVRRVSHFFLRPATLRCILSAFFFARLFRGVSRCGVGMVFFFLKKIRGNNVTCRNVLPRLPPWGP